MEPLHRSSRKGLISSFGSHSSSFPTPPKIRSRGAIIGKETACASFQIFSLLGVRERDGKSKQGSSRAMPLRLFWRRQEDSIPSIPLAEQLLQYHLHRHNGKRIVNQRSQIKWSRSSPFFQRQNTVCIWIKPASRVSGAEIRNSYPKHVWSPAGGWYSQPANWKANTAVCALVMFGITAIAWNISAEREYRTKFPEEGRFFPSR